MNIASIPTELIELICSVAVQSAIDDFEFIEAASRLDAHLWTPADLRSFALFSLPLIHPRWTIAGTKALYRYVNLNTADQYKAFENSLVSYPNNGNRVRVISIRWYRGDFGGPDGYAYKVLGWFHEMEIQNLIRLCPRLECFEPGHNSPVISQEGIAALGTLTGLRSIVWRNADFHTNVDAVIQIILRSKQLDTLRLYTVDTRPLQMMQPVFHRIKKLIVHDGEFAFRLPWSSFENLRDLDLAYVRSFRVGPTDLLQVLYKCDVKLTHLTIRDDSMPISKVPEILRLASGVQFLYIKLWFDDGAHGKSEIYEADEGKRWRSNTLKEILFQWPAGPEPTPEQHCEIFRSRLRAENLPQLKKLSKLSWTHGIPLRYNMLPEIWTPGILIRR